MSTIFWISTACLISFAAGFFVYAVIGWHRKRSFQQKFQVSSADTPANATGPSESSLRDPVTGLYNRKHLLQRLQQNIARCDRANEKMAVITWDIDGFVDFNNKYGQRNGDLLLQKVAEIIRKSIRVYDEGFRIGADEFCAMLLPADNAVAEEVMQRVSQTVSRDLFEGEKEYAGRSFSISSGLVFYPGGSKVPEALLHEAGQALYRSRLARSSSQT